MAKLTETLIVNRTKINNLHNVKRLNCWGCDLEDISLLAAMPQLEVLSLSVNRISGLEPLYGCVNLRELYLRKNEITDLDEVEYLRKLNKLRVLWLDDNPCAFVAGYRQRVLQVLPKLATLDNRTVMKEEVAAALAAAPQERSPSLDRSLPDTEFPPSAVHHYPPRQASQEESVQTYPRYGEGVVGEMAFYTPTMPLNMTQSIYQPTQVPPPSAQQPDPMTVSMIAGTTIDQSWQEFPTEEDEEPSRMVESFSSRLGFRRSLTTPRRGHRSRSVSPTRALRMDNVLNAILHLMDELDQEGLRQVIDEAHSRIKKQR